MGNVSWRRCGVAKQPPQFIRCQKRKENTNKRETKPIKNVGNALRKWWEKSHRASVCVLLDATPAKKKKAFVVHVLNWNTSLWCARRNIKIMSQENCKNKRKTKTKSAKVQGRRKEHLSVLGEATTAQYESACFPDAAPPSNERMAAKQQQNERNKNGLTAPARLRDVQRYETYMRMARHRKFEKLLSPRPTIYTKNSREIPPGRDKVSQPRWKSDANVFQQHRQKSCMGEVRSLKKMKCTTSVQQTFSRPRGVSLPHQWAQNEANHWN